MFLRSVPAALGLLALATLPARADEPEIDFSELPNGLDLIVVEKHNAPLVTIEVAVKTGSFTETPETNGLSHLYEHMFFKGNAGLPTQEAYMARVSELGIDFNGTTSTERVNYFITLPSRNFPEGMKFMADALLHPLFNEEELEKERKVVIGEYDRNEAEPSHYLREGLRERLYGDEAYRKNPLGEREVILSAGQETMYDFKEKYYVPNNSCLLVVGDVNPTEAKVLAEKLFGPRRWKPGADPHQPPRAPLPRLSETKTFVTEQETDAVTLGARWPGPDVGRDERATFVADVWGTLCALPHGPFQKRFREEELADSASLYYYTQREGGEINFQAAVRDGQVEAVRDAMLEEVAAMAEAGYWSAEDIELAKKQLRTQRAYSAESGADFAHTLSFWWASSSYDYYDRYLEATGSVTAEELRSFARNYLVGRPMVLGCLLGPENAERYGVTAESLAPPDGGGSAAAAASAVEELEVGEGLPVVFRRVPGSAVTALDLYIDGGCVGLPRDLQGIDALLMSSVLDGSAQRSRDEVLRRFTELGARTSQDANYDYARLSLVAPRESFAEALDLFAECLRSPRLEEGVVAHRRNQMLNGLRQERANPDRYVVRVLNDVFFAGHPYHKRPDGTPETVKDLTPGLLRERLSEVLTTDRARVVLVGDVGRRQARSLLDEELGFVPRGGAWEEPEVPAFSPSGLRSVEQRDVPTTYVIAKAPAPAPGHADHAAVKLTLRLLHKRLWETLRTEHALSYAQSAGISHYRGNYGYLYCSTKQPQRAVELMHEDIRRLQEEPVPAEELQGLISQKETRAYGELETAASHANGLGHALLVAGDWRHLYEEPGNLAEVTPQDVQRAAEEYLEGFTWGFIGPEAPPEAVLRGGAAREGSTGGSF